jgi:hypothetical protein
MQAAKYHFYSPIPALDEVRRDEQRIFPLVPRIFMKDVLKRVYTPGHKAGRISAKMRSRDVPTWMTSEQSSRKRSSKNGLRTCLLTRPAPALTLKASNCRPNPSVAQEAGEFRPLLYYLRFPCCCALRRRTPGPPPFPSMNSTPAASNVRRTAESLTVVIDVSPSASSARRMVVTPRVDSRARSSALQRRRARAALI